MLEESACAVLAAVNEMCGGGFKIIEEDDLAKAVPKEDVARTLALLEEKRLIELRYAEEGTYCVRTMPEGRCYAERLRRETAERERGRDLLQRGAFRGALFGGILGGLAAALAALLAAVLL